MPATITSEKGQGEQIERGVERLPLVNLANTYSNYIRNLPIQYRVGLLIFPIHLDRSIIRYEQGIKDKIEVKLKLDKNRQTNDTPEHRPRLPQADDSCVPELWPFIKYYRLITNFIHAVNLPKFLIVVMSLNGTLPVHWNCWVPGRLCLHSYLIDYMRMVAVDFTILMVIWRVMVLASNSKICFDFLIFMLKDEATIEEEKRLMTKRNQLVLLGRDEALLREDSLQTILFYKVDYGKFVLHKLRPNRTREANMKLQETLNILISLLIPVFIMTVLFGLPSVSAVLLYDRNYIRNYPSCCPELEKLAASSELNYNTISPTKCLYRYFSTILDLVDNTAIFFDAYTSILTSYAICVLVTRDMLNQWKEIDLLIKREACFLRNGKESDAMRSKVRQKNVGQRGAIDHLISPNRSMHNFADISSVEETSALSYHGVSDKWRILELQAIVCDFFDSLGRANKSMRILISFALFVFVASTLLLGYLSYNLYDFWNLTISKLFVISLYITFLVAAIILLRLKKALDKSYTQLCAVMALDTTVYKSRWLKILENYTTMKRNSFSLVMGVKLDWLLVVNLFASSVSFLVFVETYKREF